MTTPYLTFSDDILQMDTQYLFVITMQKAPNGDTQIAICDSVNNP